MFETTFVFIGVLAAGAAFISILQRFDWETRIIAAGFSFILWIVWSFSAYNVEKAITSGSGDVIIVSHRYDFLGILGFLAAVVMFLYIALYVMESFGLDPLRALGVRRG